ncbi:MAG: hypothetical protein LBI64_05485 [Coriobacteriales bacterium]|jgi:hypothetical protein|nr:hypothetical protein [Coriobacteriales bacterium]
MGKAKVILGAFFVGGCMGCICQLFNMLYAFLIPDDALLFGSATLGLAQNYTAGFSLATCGFIMMILFLTGLLPKIEKVGGFGATLPLFGLVGAAAGSTLGCKAETGAPFVKAFFKGCWPFIRFLLIAFIITVPLSLLVGNFVKPDLSYVGAVPYIDPTIPANGPALGAAAAAAFAPISLLWSFLFTGTLAVIGQIVVLLVKPKMKGILNILMCGYILGCLISMTGLFPFLAVYGTGGITAPVTGAGEFVFTSVMFGSVLGHIPGMWTTVIVRLVTFCLVITIQFIWGIIAAAIVGSRAPAPRSDAPTEATT